MDLSFERPRSQVHSGVTDDRSQVHNGVVGSRPAKYPGLERRCSRAASAVAWKGRLGSSSCHNFRDFIHAAKKALLHDLAETLGAVDHG